MDLYTSIGRRHCDRLESPATGIREKDAGVRDGKTRLLIQFILALFVSIIIVITPVEAKKGGHDHGGGHGYDHKKPARILPLSAIARAVKQALFNMNLEAFRKQVARDGRQQASK